MRNGSRYPSFGFHAPFAGPLSLAVTHNPCRAARRHKSMRRLCDIGCCSGEMWRSATGIDDGGVAERYRSPGAAPAGLLHFASGAPESTARAAFRAAATATASGSGLAVIARRTIARATSPALTRRPTAAATRAASSSSQARSSSASATDRLRRAHRSPATSALRRAATGVCVRVPARPGASRVDREGRARAFSASARASASAAGSDARARASARAARRARRIGMPAMPSG